MKKTVQKLYLIGITFTFLFFINLSVVHAQSDRNGRPPSVFSICCCEREVTNNEQVIYSCKLHEESLCPENFRHYPGNPIDCPSSLIIKKYNKRIANNL